MGDGIRKYGTGFSLLARRGSAGVDTKDASRQVRPFDIGPYIVDTH
ncbi:hypothetical protein [Paraburkholderia sp. RL17-337-BIB-A]